MREGTKDCDNCHYKFMCFTARFYSNMCSVPDGDGRGWRVWVIVHQDPKPIYAIPERGDVEWNSGTRAVFVGYGEQYSEHLSRLIDRAIRLKDRNSFCHQELDEQGARTEGVKR